VIAAPSPAGAANAAVSPPAPHPPSRPAGVLLAVTSAGAYGPVMASNCDSRFRPAVGDRPRGTTMPASVD
jgi:hypothetical protein